MAEITAALVKELREKSGAGMMDCKKALTENGGDIEQSMDWLRTKGLSKAAKKSDRVAAEGLVAVALRDDAFGRDTIGLLGRLGQALGAQPVHGRIDVAAVLGQGLLAVHHAGAGLFAQLFDESRGDLRHGFISIE